MRQIYTTARVENWGLVAVSDAQIAWMAAQLRQVLISDLALFVVWDSQPVGFFLCPPDENPALRVLRGRLTSWTLCCLLWRRRRVGELRLILLGGMSEFWRRGIEACLVRQAYGAVRPLGYLRVDLGWMLEETAVFRPTTNRWGAREVNRYRICQAQL